MPEEARVELSGEFPHRGAMRGRAAVAADHPLAVSAGAAILREGGSAADACVAMGAVMVVVQPYYSHLGGDGFAMTYEASSGQVEALNGSGPAPHSASIGQYRQLGRVPDSGALAVTVPGVVDTWWKLHERYGKLPWARLFEDAVGVADAGFAASRGLARAVDVGRGRFGADASFASIFGHLTRDGGQLVVQADLAHTLRAVASFGPDAFYRGDIAVKCRSALAVDGADFSYEDWQPPARWEQPVSAPFAGHIVHTQPPPTQGFVLPLALRLYERLLAGGPSNQHPALAQREAMARAFHVRTKYAGDPDFSGFDATSVVSDAYIEALLEVGELETPPRPDGDTTYLLAIDGAGNAVSFIQSVFAPWGAALMAPGTGILFNNRMLGFRLQAGHPNELRAGKRPLHTLHSYLVTRETAGSKQELAVVGGTPGGHRQPQANLQVLDAILRRARDPQDGLDEPRWSVGPMRGGPPTVEVETRQPDELGDAFRSAGIPVDAFPAWDGRMGRAYVAVVEGRNIAAAADLRGEGGVAVL